MYLPNGIVSDKPGVKGNAIILISKREDENGFYILNKERKLTFCDRLFSLVSKINQINDFGRLIIADSGQSEKLT